MLNLTVGIDLGGTYIKTLFLDETGEAICKKKYATGEGKPQEVLKQITDNIQDGLKEMSLHKGVVKGIGIGLPGQVDVQQGIAIYLPNLPGWHNISVVDSIAKEFNVPIIIENDVRMAAIAEKLLGAGKQVNDMICIAIGTGIGSGIFLNGKLFKGWQNGAGEIGHMTIEANGILCSCGNCGCWEMYAGGKGIARRTEKALESFTGDSELYNLTKNNPSSVTAGLVSAAASKGDLLAQKILQETAIYLGIGIANLVNIFNPQMIVIGGGVMKCGDSLLKPIEEEVRKRVMPVNRNVLIRLAEFGDWAGAFGAAEIARRSIRSDFNMDKIIW